MNEESAPSSEEIVTVALVAQPVDPDHIVGAHEIAERLGVSRAQVVHVWRKRHADFPEPIATLKTALIWDWNHVEAWARASGRLR